MRAYVGAEMGAGGAFCGHAGKRWVVGLYKCEYTNCSALVITI